MRIHLVDTSHGRGQFELLVNERYTNSLLSYAYSGGGVERAFSGYWNDLVRLHQMEAGNENAPDLRPHVHIDSGAFTAFSSGKVFDPRDYAAWAIEFRELWEHKMAALHFMNLDVIGDQDASWKNQSILESLGLEIIPIITYNADLKHLTRALDNYEYLALGGLVGRGDTLIKPWLDHCFKVIMQRFRETGVMPKVHLLGITKDWTIERYPAYSCDSSSWVAVLRFGRGAVAGLTKIPRYRESDGAVAATSHVLRAEIRKYKAMQKRGTELWKSRGIAWSD